MVHCLLDQGRPMKHNIEEPRQARKLTPTQNTARQCGLAELLMPMCCVAAADAIWICCLPFFLLTIPFNSFPQWAIVYCLKFDHSNTTLNTTLKTRCTRHKREYDRDRRGQSTSRKRGTEQSTSVRAIVFCLKFDHLNTTLNTTLKNRGTRHKREYDRD